MAFDTATTLKTPTGARLRLYSCKARGEMKGVVQINHGLSEHAGRYARFATYLADRGFHVYAHDHRGHGHTKAPNASLGSFGPEPALETVLADVQAVHGHISQMHPDLPVILFGHSMGSMIALAFLARHNGRIDAAALWNMPLALRLEAHTAKLVLAWERFRLGSDVPSRLLPRLTFQAWAKAIPDARSPFDWLSTDSKEVDRYIADPLCGWGATVGMWRAVFDLNLMLTSKGTLQAIPKALPLQLVGGADDPSTDRGKAMHRLEERLRRQGFSNLETRIYPGFRHESLNEMNRNIIMKAFVDWALRATGRKGWRGPRKP